ncbi:hypothetical protein MKX03_004364 [Papaver bracteatum]|nr:hypothetical protein MKX03_004364 [Papaver bracteatum]
MDRCFLELQVDGEEAYQTFSRVIENANAIMATYDVQVYPEKGSVAFSSGLHGWAFTLTNFANMYASKFSVEHSKMMERLWGENFFDPATKKWTNKRTSSRSCKRGFVLFRYEPIKQIIAACMNDQKDKLWPMLQKLGVTLKNDEKELIGKPLMKRVMQTWLPAATALLKMMIYHLPSPHTAQKYRVENLYEGPLDDQYANAIRNCDPESSLEARKEVIDRCPGRKCTDKEVECMSAPEVEVKRMHTKERPALDLQIRNDWNQSETRNVSWENKNLQTDRKANVMTFTDLKIFPKLGEQVERMHTKERLALDLQRRRISWGNQSETRNVIWENKNLQTDRKANVMTLTDLKIFPKVGEQGGEAIAGTLEVQANGFFYTTSSPDFHFHFHFLYRDVKKAFFRVEDKKMPPLLHFHLHDPIKVGREKRRNIQFHLVQTSVGQRRSYNSSDTIMKEKQTRDRARYGDLENFIIDVQDKWRFIPVYHYPFVGAELHKRDEFRGHLPSKPATVFHLTFAALVGLVDEPFVVADLDEIEIVYLRLKPEVMDMTIVFQNLKRDLVQINSIPIDALNLLKDRFNFAGVKYYKNSIDLDWGSIVREMADSQQTANYCPEVCFANRMLKVN